MGGGCNVPVSVLFNMSYCTLGRVHLARARAVQDVALHMGGRVVQRARDQPGEPRSLFTTDLTREVRPRKAV